MFLDKERIVYEFLPTIKRLAYDLKSHLPANVEVDDLIQEGVLALLSSLDRYNPQKGSLHSYVIKRIKGAMYDYLRKIDWLPRNLRKHMKEVEEAILKLEADGEDVTDEKIADITHLDVESVRSIKNEMVRKQLLMLDAYLTGTEESALETLQTEDDPAKNAYKEMLMDRLKMAINELEEKEQLVLSLRYEKELSLKEIGKVLGVSESRVSQILSTVLIKLRKKLEGLG